MSARPTILGRWTRPRWTAYRLGAAVLAIACFALRAWTASRWSWEDDDWRLIHWAVSKPFGSYYLTNYSGHLLPGGFLLTWAITAVSPLGRGLAVALTAATAAAGVVVWTLALREMFGERRRLLVVLALMSFSPLALRPTIWWTAAMLMLPLHLATGLCVLFTARHARKHDRGSLLAVVGSLALGLLFWEKALLVAIPVAGVLLFCSGDSVTRTLRRSWPFVASVAGLALAYLLAYLQLTALAPGERSTGFDPGTWPGLGAALGHYRDALVDVLLPAAMGGPWGSIPVPGDPLAEPATLTKVVCLVLIVLLVAVTIRSRRRAWIPLVMIGGYAVVVVSLVLMSNRVTLYGDLAIQQERYTVDVVAVGALAAAMLVTPRLGETEAAAWRRRPPAALRSRTTLLAVGAAMAVSLVVGNSLMVPRVGVSPGVPWLRNLLADIDAQAPVNIYDAEAPRKVYPPLGAEGRLSQMIAPLREKVTFDDPDRPLLVVDTDGHLRPSQVKDNAHALPGPAPGCGYAVQPGRSEAVTMSNALFDFHWGLRVTAYTGGPAILRVDVDGRRTDFRLDKGFAAHQTGFEGTARDVRLSLVPGSQPVCVTELVIGVVEPG